MGEQQDFINYFHDKVRIDQCPLLVTWFFSKLVEYKDVPEKPSREGIPKGDPMPVPRSKLILSLCRTIYPANLKKFAKLAGISYGVARVWNSEAGNDERIEELSMEFANHYVKKFCEIVENPDLMYPDAPEKIPFDWYGIHALSKSHGMDPEAKGDGKVIAISQKFLALSPLRRLFSELKHYPSFLRLSIFVRIIKLLETKGVSYDYRLGVLLFRRAEMEGAKKLNLKDFTALYSAFYKQEIQVKEMFFDTLMNCIKKGDAEGALGVASHLKHSITKDLMPHYNELAMDDLIKDFHKRVYGKRNKEKNA